MTGYNEASNEWRKEGTREDGHGKDSDGRATSPIVEHVREDGRNDSQGAGSENT
jgi:hypothetical protein